MTFDITLVALTSEPGGILGSFKKQLDSFGDSVVTELLEETLPFKVAMGDDFHFEARRTYRITLAEPVTI